MPVDVVAKSLSITSARAPVSHEPMRHRSIEWCVYSSTGKLYIHLFHRTFCTSSVFDCKACHQVHLKLLLAVSTGCGSYTLAASLCSFYDPKQDEAYKRSLQAHTFRKRPWFCSVGNRRKEKMRTVPI